LKFALVAQIDFDVRSAVNHVIVGQNRSVCCDDYARTQSLLALRVRFASAKLIAEKLAEHRVVKKWRHLIGLRLHHFGCADVYDRRQRGLDHCGKSICKISQADRQRVLRDGDRLSGRAQDGVTRPVPESLREEGSARKCRDHHDCGDPAANTEATAFHGCLSLISSSFRLSIISRGALRWRYCEYGI